MRIYQEIGLKKEAERWLKENIQKTTINYCPTCKRSDTAINEREYEHQDLFYGDGPHLKEYFLNDGRRVREVVQAEIWSSGPMVFLCLEYDDKTRIFQWTNKEINIVEEGLCGENDEVAE